MGFLARAKSVYLSTRKRHDLLFNHYFMRPIAAGAVVLFSKTRVTPNQLTLTNLSIHLVAVGLLIGLPSYVGGLIAVLVLELGYMLDCADGMLARHKQIASRQGHLFDFFTDELKAVALVSGLGVRMWRGGGYGPFGEWAPGDSASLLATIAGVIVIASATSLTNFIRRPELSGRETPIEAHYETVDHSRAAHPAARAGQLVKTFLQFLNHYPSTVWLFALVGRLDLFFWIYVAINALYVARGWVGLVLRFGRSA